MVRIFGCGVWAASVVSVCASVTAFAGPSEATFDGAGDALFLGHAMPNALLVGSFGGARGSLGRAPHGVFLGVETGLARWLASDVDVARRLSSSPDDANSRLAFGIRGGYQFRSGLALQVRFDDLGVDVERDGASLLVASAGLRYSLPLPVMPFADVLMGTLFGGVDAVPAAGLGLGVTVPVARHAAFDFTIRDWIADLGGSVRHIPTVLVGVNIGFGG